MTPRVGQRVMVPARWFVPWLGREIDCHREGVIVRVLRKTKRERQAEAVAARLEEFVEVVANGRKKATGKRP